jgi:uncharacterized membrane protein
MARFKLLTRYLLGVILVAQGINHFVNASFFAGIIPPYLPWHMELVYASGIAEIALGILLLIRRYAVLAGWGIILLFIAVFPANVHMAIHAGLYPSLPPLGLWLRLPLQGVLIAWAYWYTREQPEHLAPIEHRVRT